MTCPHCRSDFPFRPVGPLVLMRPRFTLFGPLKPKHAGMILDCIECGTRFSVDNRGRISQDRRQGVQRDATPQNGGEPESSTRPGHKIDAAAQEATARALRGRGPLVPAERPEW